MSNAEAETSTAELEHLLLFYHEQLEKRDPRKFFARPVTDDIAPGYSKIIRRPMDLSTMRQKMRKKKYTTLQDYQSDVRLMCHNAMTYNTPETVYYQKARKMLAYVEKAMIPVKAESIASDLGYAPSRSQLGLEPLDEEEEEEEEGEEGETGERDESGTTDGCTDFSPGPPRLSPEGGAVVHFDTEEDMDDATAAAIIEQAKEAARRTRRKLEDRYGGSDAVPKLAYLTISRPVSAGGIYAHECGPSAPKLGRSVILPPVEEVELFLGSGSVPAWQGEQVWRELESLNSKPREPVAAHLDWVLKGFSEETARQLVSAYGDALAVEYASSLLTFASECGAFPRTLAHKCLNILTEGEHEKVQHLWRRRIPDAIPPAQSLAAQTTAVPVTTVLSTQAVPPSRQTATVQPLQRSEPAAL